MSKVTEDANIKLSIQNYVRSRDPGVGIGPWLGHRAGVRQNQQEEIPHMSKWLALVCLAVGVPLGAQPLPSCAGSAAADDMNWGLSALRDGDMAKATARFQSAVEEDPDCTVALIYMGKAYVRQYVPGSNAPENVAFLDKALEQFQKALQQQPTNALATRDVASLYFQRRKLDDARLWYQKLIDISPENKEAYFTLGEIAWIECQKPIAEARAKLGMKPAAVGPIRDATVRQGLRARYMASIEEGIDHLNRALELDEGNQEAMAYLKLLYLAKADLEDTAGEYEEDVAKAEEWATKAAEAEKAGGG